MLLLPRIWLPSFSVSQTPAPSKVAQAAAETSLYKSSRRECATLQTTTFPHPQRHDSLILLLLAQTVTLHPPVRVSDARCAPRFVNEQLRRKACRSNGREVSAHEPQGGGRFLSIDTPSVGVCVSDGVRQMTGRKEQR